MFSIDGKEIVGLYLYLQKEDQRLDPILNRLFNRIKNDLYNRLSIEQLENLKELYQNGFDAFDG